MGSSDIPYLARMTLCKFKKVFASSDGAAPTAVDVDVTLEVVPDFMVVEALVIDFVGLLAAVFVMLGSMCVESDVAEVEGLARFSLAANEVVAVTADTISIDKLEIASVSSA